MQPFLFGLYRGRRLLLFVFSGRARALGDAALVEMVSACRILAVANVVTMVLTVVSLSLLLDNYVPPR